MEMAQMKKMLLTIALIGTTVNAAALKIEKVTVLGPMKHKVIYQADTLKKTKSKTVFTGKIVAKWGEHVYELVKGAYECKNTTCKLVDYTRLATFELCEVKDKKAVCRNKISGDSEVLSSDSSDVVYENPDEVSDTIGNSRNDDSDFPERSSGSVFDEFGDLYN